MLTFVTGNIDSGKTTRMLKLYEELKLEGADGFVCPKVFSGDRFKGYDLLRLGNKDVADLVVLESDYAGEFSRPVFFDRFVFNGECFLWGMDIISQAVSREAVRHILIDEIGPLELAGKGFTGILPLLSDGSAIAGKDFYVCVRQSCIDPLLKAIGSPDVRIIWA